MKNKIYLYLLLGQFNCNNNRIRNISLTGIFGLLTIYTLYKITNKNITKPELKDEILPENVKLEYTKENNKNITKPESKDEILSQNVNLEYTKENNKNIELKDEILPENVKLEYTKENNKIKIENLHIYSINTESNEIYNMLNMFKNKFQINNINNLNIGTYDLSKNCFDKIVDILNNFEIKNVFINIDRSIYNLKKLSPSKKNNIEYLINKLKKFKIHLTLLSIKNDKFDKKIFEDSELYKDLKLYINNNVHIGVFKPIYDNKLQTLYEV
jgi:hypothetical protein